MTKTIRYNPRRSGKTTLAMLDAPPNSIYVWVNEQLAYPKELARSLGRQDLIIISPAQVRNGFLCGNLSDLVLDHATYVDVQTRYALAQHTQLLSSTRQPGDPK